MSQASSEYLLDTSIQVMRAISVKWGQGGSDRLWETITPVTSVYSLMEFKNTVVAGLRYLADITGEVKDWKGTGDPVKLRLEEIIRFLNVETRRRAGDRKVKIASAYAAKIFAEYCKRRRAVPLDDFLREIACQAENAQRIRFLRYSVGKESKEMRVLDCVDCFLGKTIDPFVVGLGKYTCCVGATTCAVKPFLLGQVMPILSAVASSAVTVRTQRLTRGSAAAVGQDWSRFPSDKSIGQKLCFPIGDCIIVAKGKQQGMGLLTADRDQAALAVHVHMDVIFYEGNGRFTGAP